MSGRPPSLEQLLQFARARGEAENPGAPGHPQHPAVPPSSGDDPTRTFTPDHLSPQAHAESRFLAGQLIADRFTVVRFIDRGGMGEVYEVEDRLLRGARVALKVILPAIADDPATSRHFEQEVILARKINHPNLCPIYDIARSGTPAPPFLFLTMKLIVGETLSSRLSRSEPISREDRISIFRQMIAGLAAIHAGGIVHRDIKPNNVMLDHSGAEMCVVITDFGLARLHQPEEITVTGSFIAGTPGYIAPEIFAGAVPSQATDIFALGVLLHHVCTGEHPRVSSRTIEPAPALQNVDLPAALKDAVRDFLSADPQRRCEAFNLLHPASGSLRLIHPDDLRAQPAAAPRSITRRQFAIGSAALAGIAAGGISWKWEQLYDLLHPLPTRRFVALLNWPASDTSVRPVLLGIIDSIGRELARAEAFDRNLLVLSSGIANPTTAEQLNEARESLGANLVLAASAAPARSGELHLVLRVLDPSATTALRSRQLRVPVQHQDTLPEKAVRAAVSLLSIRGYQPDEQRIRPGTTNPEAFIAFRDAEALRKQENDTGLDQAIQKYKQAIELDPTYAAAQSSLAWAYLREYALTNDPGSLTLASLNCKSAIQRDPNLVDAHLGLASVLQITGDMPAATTELSRALALDPSDPHTLVYQADFYAGANQWTPAEQTFARVLSLRPNYWLGHQELGVLLYDQGKYHEALVQFRAASLAAPRNALAIKNTGSVYLQLGQLQQASDYLQTSYSIKANSDAAADLAELLRIQHKYTEALDYAERAIRLNPNAPETWIQLAQVQSSAGHRREAEQAYRQAAAYQEDKLRTSPKYGPKWMSLALCRAKTGQAGAALTLVARAEANHADDMESQLLKLRILELAGMRDEALATLRRCLSRAPAQFQLQVMPDLEKLRTTPEYKSIVASSEGQI